ncbi:MAG: methylated-DNA--[Bacteroidales bacterium]|nr:methylated-DNA--[protein]-cysteine S-methyltransferase [Bacteroidales bacterium]
MKEGKITIKVQTYESPCGKLILGTYGEKLCLCDWEDEKRHPKIKKRISKLLHSEYTIEKSPLLVKVSEELDEYFSGERQEFDIPLLLLGSEFQKKVWQSLLSVPYGKTISYGMLAKEIGDSKSARAVACANGANAISVFVPCHRVIGSDNSLTGYGGGLGAKRYLLNLECGYGLFCL